MTRARVSTGDVQRRIRPRHSEYVRHGTVVVEPCQAVMADHIRVGSAGSDGTVLPFDYLIIASGTSYAENIKAVSPSLDYRLRQFAAERKSLEAAERVVVIGGGILAMETCGDVRDAFPNKELILVCRSTILRKSGPVPHPILKADWEARGVRVVDHEAMLPLEDGATHYVTDKGTKVCPVEGTRAIWCIGRGAPNAQFMPKTSLDAFGYIRVNKHLQVDGFKEGNVFAMGDVCYSAAFTYGDRGLLMAGVHGFVARENVLSLAEQAARGVTVERQRCTDELPFAMDQELQRTGFGRESFKACTLGYGRYCIVSTPGVKQRKQEGAAHAIDNLRFITDEEMASKAKVKIVTKSIKGGYQMGHIMWCDALRTPDEKPHWAIADQFARKSDAKGMMSLFSVILNHPWMFGMVFRLFAVPMKGAKKAGTFVEHDEPMQEAFNVEALFEDADAVDEAAAPVVSESNEVVPFSS